MVAGASPYEPPRLQHDGMQAPDHITPLPATRDDNGILGRVEGQFIAQAGRSLPDPACAAEDEKTVEIDAGCAGRVRLTFKRRRYSRPRAKSSYFTWLCTYAEAVTTR